MRADGESERTPPEPGDGAVLAASVEDPDRIAVIFDRHGREILSFLTRRVGATDAEDLLGEVFLVVMRRRSSFDEQALDARPWLYGIAANLLHRRRRQEARHLRAVSRVSHDQGLGILDDLDEDVVDRLDAQRTSAQMSGALAGLAARDREVLLLTAWAELSQAEIASALDVPVGTVKSRLHRARHRLRASLAVPEPNPAAVVVETKGLCHG